MTTVAVDIAPATQFRTDAPRLKAMREEVRAGLSSPRKTLPCKYFYDARGAELFDRICNLTEYYPTRTEEGILHQHAADIARRMGGQRCALIEYGSGSSRKTRILLDQLPGITYIPIDISRHYLDRSAERLHRAYPDLSIQPIRADYTRDFPAPRAPGRRPVVFFPGSTIGNFHPDQAVAFLRRMAGVCGQTGGILIGVDLQKDVAILEAAYNDADGVTATFNLNLLHHLNRELGADFDTDQFTHHAPYNTRVGRIEMHLVSDCRQSVHIGGATIHFVAGEQILTECSYKYTLEGFAALVEQAGLRVEEVWTDPRHWFSVQYLVPC